MRHYAEFHIFIGEQILGLVAAHHRNFRQPPGVSCPAWRPGRGALVQLVRRGQVESGSKPPAGPIGLTGVVSHDSVSLNSSDPGDDAIEWPTRKGVPMKSAAAARIDPSGLFATCPARRSSA